MDGERPVFVSPPGGGWHGTVPVSATLLPAPLAALAAARLAGLPWWPAALLIGLVTAGALALFLRTGERRSFGVANGITLFRLDLTACLFAAWWAAWWAARWTDAAALPSGQRLSWAVFAMAALALALDGVDGWLARRRGEATAFGARFDMLSDTVFTIVLALCAWRFGQLGPWVLAIGLLRPGFLAAGLVWPRLTAPLPPSRRRRTACGTALLLLTMTIAPPLVPGAVWLAALSLGILLLSFGLDLQHLLGRRQHA